MFWKNFMKILWYHDLEISDITCWNSAFERLSNIFHSPRLSSEGKWIKMNHLLRDSHASYFTFRIPKWWHAQKLSLLENRTIWHTAQFDSAAAGSITQRNYVTLSVIMTSYFSASASANRYKARVFKKKNITHFDQNTESRSAVTNWNYHLHPISVHIKKSILWYMNMIIIQW